MYLDPHLGESWSPADEHAKLATVTGAHDMTADTSNIRAMLALALGMLAVVLIPELTHPGFYYADDVRHYFMPQVMDIGLRLQQGEMPWMTVRSWFSGNYVGDGVLSLFNPINLGLYWLCGRIGDPEMAALLFSGTYLYLTALGVYWLARAYTAPRQWAVVAALAYCSSAYLMYWYAASWWNALVGICWMVWAWTGWRCFIREQRLGLMAFASTFFLLVSGWPHSVIMAVLIVLIELYVARDRFILASEIPGARIDWRAVDGWKLAAVFALALCAAGASMLSNYPAYAHAAESARSSWGMRGGSDWVGSLDYLIAAGWPSFLASPSLFWGKQASLPVFYLAWFVPPALLLLIRRDNRLTCSALLPLLVIAAIATLLSLGPEQYYVLRWPLRFLTYAHIALVIAACITLPQMDLQRGVNKAIWLGYAAAGAVISFLVDPVLWPFHVAFSCIALLGLMLAAAGPASAVHRPTVIATFLLLIHLMLHLVWPQNANVGEWPVPHHSYVANPESLSGNSRVVLMPSAFPCENGKCHFASGNIGMWEQGRAVNGYTPVGQRPYHTLLGFNIWSWSESMPVAAYFVRDQVTGKARYELMRIDEFRVVGSALLKRLNEVKRGEWNAEPLSNGTVLRRTDMPAMPGTVSWITPGLRLDGRAELSSLQERLTVLENQPDADTARIVFARAWYPGYEADLDGQPLEVERHGNFLVSVILPAGRSGNLTLRYRPAGSSWTRPLAALCTILAILIVLQVRRTARHKTESRG